MVTTDPLATLAELVERRAHEFKAKLNFVERCEILALLHHGISANLVAEAYGVNRRTVGHIKNEDSVHYRDVRKKCRDLGIPEFKARYITEEVAEKVRSADKSRAALRQTARDELSASQATGESNPRANRHQGLHTVRHELYDGPITVDILFLENEQQINDGKPVDGIFITGWVIRVPTGSDPLYSQTDDEGKPFATSTAAYQHALAGKVDAS